MDKNYKIVVESLCIPVRHLYCEDQFDKGDNPVYVERILYTKEKAYIFVGYRALNSTSTLVRNMITMGIDEEVNIFRRKLVEES